MDDTGQASKAMLMRTWPNAKGTHTVATAGTPVDVDLKPYMGKTCYFRAITGKIFGRSYHSDGSAPTIVDGEDFDLAAGGVFEELYVSGAEGADDRLTIDSDTSGAELVVLFVG